MLPRARARARLIARIYNISSHCPGRIRRTREARCPGRSARPAGLRRRSHHAAQTRRHRCAVEHAMADDRRGKSQGRNGVTSIESIRAAKIREAIDLVFLFYTLNLD
jgi:hypothetical protein